MTMVAQDHAQALSVVSDLIAETIGRPVQLTGDEDLLQSEILDSLDGIRFFFRLEETTGMRLPSEDLAGQGFYKVERLVAFLLSNGTG